MPESKSMMGKLLNNMLTTEADRKEGTPRKQRIDGTNLPEFEAVRRYFGPHAGSSTANRTAGSCVAGWPGCEWL